MFRKIKDDIYSVGVIDWHRKLFDELIPLPDGTSYNSCLLYTSPSPRDRQKSRMPSSA